MARNQRLFSLLTLISSAILFSSQPIVAVNSSYSSHANSSDFIRTSCSATLYPDLCYSSLSGYSSAVQKNPGQLARVAVGLSLSRARRMEAYLSNVSRQADYGAEPRVASAVHDCFSTMSDAVDQIRGSLKQLRHLVPGAESFRLQMSNVQTWMSAALTNEDTCTDGFEDVPDGPTKTEVCNRVSRVTKFTSNALALVNNYAAQGTDSSANP
ncbi:Pectinesterase inhibitor domain [Dillenia turbinata]|uniref:Pectinesterase inhibitor domain n=1 Tax=Dillenia turbinata TaxID=194707 RepID=A0AAN8VAX9_9MAGN